MRSYGARWGSANKALTAAQGVTKLAPTALAASIVTVQASLPLQAPLQPVKRQPAAGVAFSVTVEPPS